MYESHFLLSHRPFAAAPSADAYIPTGSLEQSRQTLIRCIDRAEGPGLVIGPAGTGKSLLCQILAAHFRGRFQVAHLAGARLCTRRALLQNILFELKLPYRDMDEGELRLSLVDHLEPRSGGPDGLLLLVDEAHTLPLRLLEEVRLLTNVVRDGKARVRLVLVGGMALEERLTSPKLESFHQRIAARCYLQPLGRDETIYYVQEQIRRCGASADGLFTGEAQASVYTATDGIPRLINQVCDHGLMLAALGGHRQIDAAGIEEAWADLQQLPVPLHETRVLSAAGSGGAGGIVEFGQLGEQPVVAGTIGKGVGGRESGVEGQGTGVRGQGTELGSLAVASLDSISRTIDALAGSGEGEGVGSGSGSGDFSPSAVSGTEVELFFHSAHDPFGGHWEEEEVVIDRYASLEDAAVRSRRVTSDEGRAIGAAVSAAGETSGEQSDEIADVCTADKNDCLTDPASDPLYPEETLVKVRPRRTAVSLSSVAHDDRDMIVVDEEQSPRPGPPVGRPRRAEYRQLFSRLRGK